MVTCGSREAICFKNCEVLHWAQPYLSLYNCMLHISISSHPNTHPPWQKYLLYGRYHSSNYTQAFKNHLVWTIFLSAILFTHVTKEAISYRMLHSSKQLTVDEEVVKNHLLDDVCRISTVACFLYLSNSKWTFLIFSTLLQCNLLLWQITERLWHTGIQSRCQCW